MLKAMLRGLLAHKLRLVLSALAVVLGTMFMSGAFIGGDTISDGFTSLFSTVNADLDVQVTAKSTAPGGQDTAPTSFIDQATATKLSTVDGVARAIDQVRSDGARVVGPDGKLVTSRGAPMFGIGWVNDPNGLAKLRTGRAPTAPTEVAIDGGLANTTGYGVGSRVGILTPHADRATYTVVGVFGYEGGRDNLGGETTVAFTIPRRSGS